MVHMTMCLTGVSAKQFCSTAAKFSKITMALEPESFN